MNKVYTLDEVGTLCDRLYNLTGGRVEAKIGKNDDGSMVELESNDGVRSIYRNFKTIQDLETMVEVLDWARA
jgi:hypothetical protein